MYLPIIQVCKTNLLQNIACDCHLVGSMRNDCEQMTGRCMCRPNFVGLKCERCKDGRLIIDGCDSGDNVSVGAYYCKVIGRMNEILGGYRTMVRLLGE